MGIVSFIRLLDSAYAGAVGRSPDSAVGGPSHCHRKSPNRPPCAKVSCTTSARAKQSSGVALDCLPKARPTSPGTRSGATCSIHAPAPNALKAICSSEEARRQTRLQPTSRQFSRSSDDHPRPRIASISNLATPAPGGSSPSASEGATPVKVTFWESATRQHRRNQASSTSRYQKDQALRRRLDPWPNPSRGDQESCP